MVTGYYLHSAGWLGKLRAMGTLHWRETNKQKKTWIVFFGNPMLCPF